MSWVGTAVASVARSAARSSSARGRGPVLEQHRGGAVQQRREHREHVAGRAAVGRGHAEGHVARPACPPRARTAGGRSGGCCRSRSTAGTAPSCPRWPWPGRGRWCRGPRRTSSPERSASTSSSAKSPPSPSVTPTRRRSASSLRRSSRQGEEVDVGSGRRHEQHGGASSGPARCGARPAARRRAAAGRRGRPGRRRGGRAGWRRGWPSAGRRRRPARRPWSSSQRASALERPTSSA